MDIAELIRIHYRMQSGRFVSRCQEVMDGIVVQSEVSAAPMWNHAAWLGGGKESLDAFVCDLADLWDDLYRRPVLYAAPHDCTPDEIDQRLKESGYEGFDRESWMIHPLQDFPLHRHHTGLRMVRASKREADDLVAVFQAAYQITDARYGAELRRQILDEGAHENEIFHYVGYARNRAVCIATVIEQDGQGGIYNVGTLPSERGQGHAGELLACIVNREGTRGLRQLILQVDAGGGAERLYERLGFQRKFVRFGYRLKHWTPPPVQRVLGGTGYQPVPSGDSPDGMRRASDANARGTVVPVGGSPTRAGESPAPPIFEERYQSIGELFAGRAAQTPHAIALVFPGGSAKEATNQELTYRQLNEQANRLAHSLQKLGVGPNAFVGIFLERSPEMLVALLAIWKAGAVVMPLDPAFPPERLALMLRETEPLVILTQQTLASRLPPTSRPTLNLDSSGWRSGSSENPPCHGRESDLAYVIYTSGSTGEPKGVLVPNGALVRHALECCEFYEITAADRVLQFSSLNFDAAFEQIVPALIGGACLVLRSEEVWSVQEFAPEIARHGLTIIDVPTAYWHQLAHEWASRPERVPDNEVRLVLVGGEAMQPETLRLWRRTPFRQVRLLNAYGPTETTITATTFEVTPEFLERESVARVPIGRPRGGRRVHILDEAGQEVPFGGMGELCFSGRFVARGYLKRPKLTQAKFLADPLSDHPSERLYRTGDLARYLADGNIEFLGRMDDQVKIRGFRIELGEIESNLLRHPAVRAAAVIVHEGPGRDKKLVACVVGKTPPEPTAKELRRFLQQTLPEYMMPAHFVVLDALPLLPSGKVDKRALALAAPRVAQNDSAGKGPSEPFELRLQLVFEKVLNRCPIGVDVSFFELGGDSLQALEVLVQIEQITGKSLPLGTLYQTSTVEGLARLLKTNLPVERDSPLIPLQTNGTRPPVFLIHTTPGDILGYGNLIYHLDSDQPCYGLQSLGLHRPDQCHERIEDMARSYIGLIRALQPYGPYYLGGWCYGGIVSVEMANQLLDAGEQVAFLGLLETVAPRPSPRIYRYYLHRWRCLFQMKPRQWLPYVRSKFRYFKELRHSNQIRFQRVSAASAEMQAACEQQNQKLAQLERVYRSNMAALARYRPRPYPGRVTLFNAAEIDPGIISDPEYGWPGLADAIEIHAVAGDHDTMLAEPHVAILAEKFNLALQAAQCRAGCKERSGLAAARGT